MIGHPVHAIEAPATTLGEGPMWSVREGALYWIDIVGKAVFRYRPGTGTVETRILPFAPSALFPARSGGMLLVTKKGLAHFDFIGNAVRSIPSPAVDVTKEVFNDGTCDRHGRLWIGTRDLHASGPAGRLYRMEADHAMTPVAEGFVVSNGIAFSPDGRTLYHTDSRPGRIDRYDFDEAAGTVSNRRVFLDYAGAKGGRPDGCTVDAEGGLWVAEVGGWRIARYRPDGSLDREVRLPVSKPTSVMFGGPDLSTLYITTMRFGLSEDELRDQPWAGSLLHVEPGVRGLEEHEFAG